MIYENVKGINKTVCNLYENNKGLTKQSIKRYRVIEGTNKIVYEISNNLLLKQVANFAFTLSNTKSLNLSTSMNFSSVVLDGIEELTNKYYIYSIGGSLFYSNNTFAGSICLYNASNYNISFVSTVGKCTLANTNGNINVQYGNVYGYRIFDNTVKGLKISNIKQINRVRLLSNGSWHNNYTYISGFNIFLYDVVKKEETCN